MARVKKHRNQRGKIIVTLRDNWDVRDAEGNGGHGIQIGAR